MNELDLPPYDPIPDDVRNRMRRTVRSRIRRSRYRAPMHVAAGVALLAAATVVVMARPTSTNTPASPPRGETALARCTEAVQQAGKASSFPDVRTWRVANTYDGMPYGDIMVLGIVTDTQPIFCEVTETAVTVTDPNASRGYAAGTQTAMLMLTKHGMAAGVVDPSWPAAFFYSEAGAAAHVPKEGLFIYHTGTDKFPLYTKRVEANHWTENGPRRSDSDFQGGAELPKPAPPALSVVDRPAPPPDRASETGRKLGACLARTNQPMLDADTYNPGAALTGGGSELIIARSRTKIGACSVGPRRDMSPLITFSSGFPVSEAGNDLPLTFYPGHFGSRPTLGGTLPPEITRMEIRFGNGTTVHPNVADSTFLVPIPEQVEVNGSSQLNDQDKTTVKLYAASGAMTYEGPLRFWQLPRHR